MNLSKGQRMFMARAYVPCHGKHSWFEMGEKVLAGGDTEQHLGQRDCGTSDPRKHSLRSDFCCSVDLKTIWRVMLTSWHFLSSLLSSY